MAEWRLLFNLVIILMQGIAANEDAIGLLALLIPASSSCNNQRGFLIIAIAAPKVVIIDAFLAKFWRCDGRRAVCALARFKSV